MPGQPSSLGVIVGVDGSAASRVAVDWAARDAALRRRPRCTSCRGRQFSRGFRSLCPPPISRTRHRAPDLADARDVVRSATAGAEPVRVEERVISGQAISALADLTKDADMIVVGSRGLGSGNGGCSARSAPGWHSTRTAPVAVIHDEDPLIPHPAQALVVVGIDGSPASEHATAMAFRRGVAPRCRSGGGAHLEQHPGYELPDAAWSEVQPEEDMLLAERLAGWQERYPDVSVRRVVRRDQPARRLLEEAAAAQLLVVGSHGRGGFAGMLLGSVGSQVVQSARGPVIVARSS